MSASSELLSGAVVIPHDRVRARGVRRAAARYDEDTITLAAEAALATVGELSAPVAAVLFASVAPPYDEGGCAQALAEIAGLGDAVFTADLTSTPRDGLAALRLAGGLVATGCSPVLVCAAHVRRPSGEREAGDGAVAVVVGDSEGVATLTPVGAHAEELRDRWRLPGEPNPREADPSFTDEFGAARVARELGLATRTSLPVSVAAGAIAEHSPPPPTLVAGPSARAASRAERALGGPGDAAFARTGFLGAAHPLLRLLLGLDGPAVVVAGSGGLADAVLVEPGTGAAQLARQVQEQVAAGRDVDATLPIPAHAGFEPYASSPRAWRERGQDLRLEGVVREDRVLYPPPAGLEGERRPLARAGAVITYTRDHVYPGADGLDMAVVALDDGARFYGQVVAGESVQIGDRVRLVPRRLHAGGGLVQYFWKVARADSR